MNFGCNQPLCYSRTSLADVNGREVLCWLCSLQLEMGNQVASRALIVTVSKTAGGQKRKMKIMLWAWRAKTDDEALTQP